MCWLFVAANPVTLRTCTNPTPNFSLHCSSRDANQMQAFDVLVRHGMVRLPWGMDLCKKVFAGVGGFGEPDIWAGGSPVIKGRQRDRSWRPVPGASFFCEGRVCVCVCRSIFPEWDEATKSL